MYLVRIVLAFFGLSKKYKKLDQFCFGLFITAFILSTVQVCLSFSLFGESLLKLIIKINILILCFVLIIVYTLLKKRIDKYYGVYDEIYFYYKKITKNKEKKSSYSLIFICICFIGNYISLMLLNYTDDFQNIFKNEMIKIEFRHHGPITGLICIGTFYLIEFIWYEYYDKYYKILELSNDFIEGYLKYQPTTEQFYLVRDVINKFEVNEHDFHISINPLIRLKYLIQLSMNLVSLCIFLYLIESNACFSIKIYIILNIIFFNLYFISIQLIIVFKSRIQTKLLFNIDTWINSSPESFARKLVPKISSNVQQNNDNIDIHQEISQEQLSRSATLVHRLSTIHEFVEYSDSSTIVNSESS